MKAEYTIGRILPEDTWALRAAVLWPEKEPGIQCALPVDLDAGVFHLGARKHGEVICIATFMPDRHPALGPEIDYRLRAMATHSDHRGRGVGRQILEHGITELREHGIDGVWADARHAALGFYASLGWEVTGPSYEVTLRGLHRLVWRRTDEVINR